jgi:hypothetical protein
MFIELRVPAVPRCFVQPDQPDQPAGRQSPESVPTAIAAAVDAAATRGSPSRTVSAVTSTRAWAAGPLSIATRSIW